MRVIVVGAGVGGLSSALRLARRGVDVELVEASERLGGLAGSFEAEVDGEAVRFDGGPYILLDRPGLTWAFEALGESIDALGLIRLDEVYRVSVGDGPAIAIRDSLDDTADALEQMFQGAGGHYRRFIERVGAVYDDLAVLQRGPRPSPWSLIRAGALSRAPFLLKSLGSVLAESKLPGPVCDALAVWTHIAGQKLEKAPSPLAFVPPIIHREGAFTIRGGMSRVADHLVEAARAAGVRIRTGAPVRRVLVRSGAAVGVELHTGEQLDADAVLSNAPGIGTYLDLLERPPLRARWQLGGLPLQSPGVAAYLWAPEVEGDTFLDFKLFDTGWCRGLATPGAVDDAQQGRARLLGPVDHGWAARVGPVGQRAYLEAILEEPWWRERVPDARIVETRIPVEWGRRHFLYKDSMNPVMTARFMRRGRIAHRSPWVSGLYLAGSATHPGQWVSFCAISGILAADQLWEDACGRA